jgi:hypothetical protein
MSASPSISEERMPWERQLGESRKAFESFVAARTMGEEYTNAKVALRVGKSEALMRRWAKQWNWASRIDAWLREIDRARLRTEKQEILQMNERQANLGRGMMGVASVSLSRIGARLQKNADEFLKVEDTVRLGTAGAEIERKARLPYAGRRQEESDSSDGRGAQEIRITLEATLRKIDNFYGLEGDAWNSSDAASRAAIEVSPVRLSEEVYPGQEPPEDSG